MFTPIGMTGWPRFLPVFFGYAADNPLDVKFVDWIGLKNLHKFLRLMTALGSSQR
jgi:hypothetical protein